MLTGVPEKEQPEARRGFPKTGPVDRWNFIYKEMHKKNYITMEADDGPDYSAFQYRLHGFNKQPTTSYPRPLWLQQQTIIFNQFTCPHKFHYKYLRDYFDAYAEYNKFGIVFHNIMHGSIDRVENIDQDTVDFLKSVQVLLYFLCRLEPLYRYG